MIILTADDRLGGGCHYFLDWFNRWTFPKKYIIIYSYIFTYLRKVFDYDCLRLDKKAAPGPGPTSIVAPNYNNLASEFKSFIENIGILLTVVLRDLFTRSINSLFGFSYSELTHIFFIYY